MKKKKNNALPMSLTKRIVLFLLTVFCVVAVIYLGYYIIHFRLYNHYKDFTKDYAYEEGSEYRALNDSDKNLPGWDLVAETDVLKLYTDTKTTYVAVYDKRTGNIVYSNPLNADDDTVANAANKNFLKSAVIVQYYNADVTPGTLNSYATGVKNGNYTYESIENGVRYTYTLGKTGEDEIHFDVPVEYRLNDDYVEVSVPVKGIKEYNGSIYRIQLLRFFGASSDAEDGYIVVPNGSGSIINYNNGKNSAALYSQYIYDIDPISANYTTVENLEAAKLPIYAMCGENGTLLASVEEGASVAVITAGISGSYNQYNYAYPTFVLRNADNLRMFGNSTTDVYVLEKTPYDINCTIRYTLLPEDYEGYTGVAKYYRERLIKEGNLTAEKTNTGDIPFYMDVIAGVQEESHMLGVQYIHPLAMTTFDEAATISDRLSADGIGNQVMNLVGWFNDGVYNDAVHDIRLIRKLGSKSDFEALSATVADNGGRFYADAAIQKVPFTDRGFVYNTESSKYYSGYAVSFGVVNPTTLRNTANLGYNERRYNLISPRYLPRYVEKFASKISKYDIEGISLRDMGNLLYSDKRRTLIIDRQQAYNILDAQLKTLEGTGKKLMTQDTNAYAFKYSSDIINAPLYANEFAITDADIPLYEMIVHGYISYSSTLLNFDSNIDKTKLKLELIEAGASPHYVFTYQESSLMKDTATNNYYSTTFDVWEEPAVLMYRDVNEALKYVNGAVMTEHKIFDNGLRKVTYDNGVTIYINYTEDTLKGDGVSVPALSYRMEGIS